MNEEHTSKKKKVGLVVLIILIVGAAAVIALNPFANMKSLKPDLASSQETQEKAVIAVTVTTLQEGVLQNSISGNGNVVDTQSLDVYPEVVGNLTYLNAKVGDVIEKDQILAKIDPSKAGVTYKESVVKAPVAGTILSVNFAKGALVSSQAPLLRIGMLKDLEVEMDIAERFVGKVAIGTQATLQFQAYPDMVFSAKVSRLSPVLNAASRTLEIGILFDDPEHLIKAGMFPSVVILTDRLEDVLIIPRSSVLYEGSQGYVYVVDEQNNAVRKNVSLGLVVSDDAQVLSGLTAGERVVVQGQTLLTDGTAVRIVE